MSNLLQSRELKDLSINPALANFDMLTSSIQEGYPFMANDKTQQDSQNQSYQGVRIEAAEIRIVTLPLISPFVISTGTMVAKTFPLLILKGEGLEGFAEGVMDPAPDYLEETIAGAMDFLKNYLLPSVLGKHFESPYDLQAYLTPWRGNYMTKALLEMAFWDLWAKTLNVSLTSAIGGIRQSVDVGVSLGIAPIDTTLERIAIANEAGYKRIKLKIAQSHDVGILETVRKHFPETVLTVDANTHYTFADTDILTSLDDFNLDYIEQPLAHDDIHDHAQLQSILDTDICLDESIRNASHARKALQMGAARVINIKVGRVGGYTSARAIHDICAAFDVPVWCGGMLESGIGRAHNIHLATLPKFTKPGDTSSASRYFTKDIINESLESVAGSMQVPTHGPGIGVTLDHSYLDSMTQHSETIMPS